MPAAAAAAAVGGSPVQVSPRSESRQDTPASTTHKATVEVTDASNGPAPPTKALAAMALRDGRLPPAPPAAAPAVHGGGHDGGERAEAEEPAGPGASAASAEPGLEEEVEEDGEAQEMVGFEGHGFPPPGQLVASVSDPGGSGPQQLVRLCMRVVFCMG